MHFPFKVIVCLNHVRSIAVRSKIKLQELLRYECETREVNTYVNVFVRMNF